MKNRGHRSSDGKGREKEEARSGRSRRAGTDEDAAVEELLRSAQDEIMLKLSVDSHISKTSNGSDSLPSNLRRRFDALKSAPASTSSSSSAALKSVSASSPAVASAGQSQGDLMARFDALKVKGRSSSGAAPPVLPSPDLRGSGGFSTIDNDEDEVEKIIRWAKDAARLDPSPSDDDDDDCHSDDDGDVTD